MGALFRTPIVIAVSQRPKSCRLRVICYPLIQSPLIQMMTDSMLDNQPMISSTLLPRDAAIP